jgi:uncharacterized protein
LRPVPARRARATEVAHIIGDAEFRSSDHAQAFVGQLMVAYNRIVDRLRAGKGVGPRCGDPQVVGAWCRGYVEVALRDPQWVDDREAVAMLLPLRVLAGEVDEDSLEPKLADLTQQLKVEWVEQLPRIVAEIDEFWRVRRGDATAAPGEIGAAPAVGRKRPCPCGSGKKYKRCCGATR